MAEQKEIRRLEPERNPDLFHFVHVARKFPQLRDIRLVGVVGAELIVVVELDPGLGEEGVAGLEVLVRAAWAGVQQQQLDAGIVAEAPCPSPERAVRRRHRYAAYAAGKAVVARGVVEVCRHRPSGGGLIVAVGQGIPLKRCGLAYLENPTTRTMAIPTGQTYRSANNSSRCEATDRPLSSPPGIRFPIRQPMNTLTRSAEIGMSRLAARKSTTAKKFNSARWGIDLSGCQSVQRTNESTEP